ncbi:MAG TPA: hypothetical protein VF185_01930 [Patescibacteria group bacterium]
MTGKEKLYFLLDTIDDARSVSPSGQPLIIDPANDLNDRLRGVELEQLFTKLEKDEQVLKILQIPSGIKTISIVEDADPYDQLYENDDGCWHIELLPAFDDYFLKIQNELEYQEFTGKKPSFETDIQRLYEKIQKVDEQISIRREAWAKAQSTISDNSYYSEATRTGHLAKLEQQAQTDIGNFIKQKETYLVELNLRKTDVPKSSQAKPFNEEDKSNSDKVYEITYISRDILLNNTFHLAKPDFDSENEVVFSFLFNNPNQTFSRTEIEVEIRRKIAKSLHKIVENLGFVGDLKKVFFNVSKDSICFKNPVTRPDLDKLGVVHIKLP